MGHRRAYLGPLPGSWPPDLVNCTNKVEAGATATGSTINVNGTTKNATADETVRNTLVTAIPFPFVDAAHQAAIDAAHSAFASGA